MKEGGKMNFNLKTHRELNGMTQKQLAQYMHKAIATIQSWESGTSYPNAEALCELCELFGTDPNTMLGWYDDHPREDAGARGPCERELLECYRSSTAGRKDRILDTARDAAAMSKDAAEPALPASDEVSA